MCNKYIIFKEDHTGDDGYEYFKDVKYAIKNETDNAVYVVGKKNSINKFLKTYITQMSESGWVISELKTFADYCFNARCL